MATVQEIPNTTPPPVSADAGTLIPASSMDAINQVMNGGELPPELKAPKQELPVETQPEETNEEAPVEQDLAEEAPPEEEAVEEPVPKAEKPVAPATKAKAGEAQPVPQRRRYDKYSPEDQAVLRRMPNAQFAAVTPLLDKYKARLAEAEAKVKEAGEIPATLYQHPDGYTLTPEHKQFTEASSLYDRMESHFVEQAKKLEEGEDWEDLQAGENGKIIRVKMAASVEGKLGVQRKLHELNALRGQLKTQHEQLKSGFANRHNAIKSFIKNELEEKILPSFADKELAKPERAADKEAYDSIISKLPREMNDHWASFVAKMFLGMRSLSNQLADAKKGKTVQELRTRGRQITQPKAAATVGGAPKISADPFNLISSIVNGG